MADGTKLDMVDGPLYIWDACEACNSDSIIDVSALAFTALKGGSCAGTNPDGLTINVLNNQVVPYSGGTGTATGGVGGTSTAVGTTGADTTAIDTTAVDTGGLSTATASTAGVDTTATTSTAVVATSSSAVVPSYSSAIQGASDATTDFGLNLYEAEVTEDPITVSTDPTVTTSTRAATTTTAGSCAIKTTAVLASEDNSGSCTFGEWQCSGSSLQICNYASNDQLCEWHRQNEHKANSSLGEHYGLPIHMPDHRVRQRSLSVVDEHSGNAHQYCAHNQCIVYAE